MNRRSFFGHLFAGIAGIGLATTCRKKEEVDDKVMAFGSPEVPSRLTNCFIRSRNIQKGPMFTVTKDGIFCNLDGYTIVPSEEFKSEIKKI